MKRTTPPHSIEAEKGVLGSMIVNPSEAIPEAARHLNRFHFFNPVHRTIFEALVETHKDEGGIDLITFTQALRDRGKLEEVGGAWYVTELSTFVPCAANIHSYIEIVLEKYALRSIIDAGTEAVRRAHEPRADVGETLAFVAHQLDAIKWTNGSGLPAIQDVSNLGSLLGLAVDRLKRWITFPSDNEAIICALWPAHTHCVQHFPYTPYVSITSPAKQCGKSNLLICLSKLCARPWYSISPSVAVVFRKIERDVPTLLLDESDRCLKDAEETKQELLSILNAGYKRGATVDRCGGANKTDLESFHVFCPKAFAGIGDLPDTIADRCLSICMQRQKAGSKHFYEDEVEADLLPIRDGFEKWAATPGLGDKLNFKIPKTDFPDSLSDRAREVCEPLYRIAKLAGGDWFDRIKNATAVICGGQEDQDKSVLVVGIVRDVYGGRDEISAHDLIDGIIQLEHPCCPDWWFKKDVDHASVGRSLAKILTKFGRTIKTQPTRIDGKVVKVYKRSDLEPIWERYCPPTSLSPETGLSVTSVTPQGELPSDVTVVTVGDHSEGGDEKVTVTD